MTVLITGASGGLGRAMALECAERGYDLFLTDISADKLEEIAQGIMRQCSVRVVAKACDLTDAKQTAQLFETIDEGGIKLTMLLNIAGVDFEGGFMARQCDQLIDIVQLNIEATLRVTHLALERRRPGDMFCIAIVSSLASLYPIPLKATYAASKRFLLDFSIALRQELCKDNVRVLALCPGGLPTTKEACEGIAAQGFWGNLTTNSLTKVSRRTITKLLAGRGIYIPGLANRVLSVVSKIVPRPLIAKLLYRRWHTAQDKWLAHDH